MADSVRRYTGIVIASPSLNEEALTKLKAALDQAVVRLEGKIVDWTSLGKRRLTYKIKRFSEGNYFQVQMELPPKGVEEFRKVTALMDSVLRLMVIQGAPAAPEASPKPEVKAAAAVESKVKEKSVPGTKT